MKGESVRNRIVGLRWVSPSELKANPKNWRRHPRAQRDALAGVLREIGSGATLIACERLGRICYGMEIEPRYVQVSIERWQNYTGRKAVKLDHGD